MLVVLDLGLEDGGGLALLDRLRSSDGLASCLDPELPVIVLTGRAGEADGCTDAALEVDHFPLGTRRLVHSDSLPGMQTTPVSVLQRELWVCREGDRPAARPRQAPGYTGRAGRSRLAAGPDASRAHQVAAARRG